MRITLLLALLATTAGADFADDQYAPDPNALSRIVAATEQYGQPLRSTRDEATSYYLRRAEYVGPCDAPFDTVHVARLFYIRSAPPGSKAPARGHTFVVFADRDFRIRSFWSAEFDLGPLSVSGSKLRVGETTVLDYTQLPASDTVLVDGKPQGVPKWR